MGLNICPFQPQKWLCSSGGWFLSIQGSSEAWKSLSIRHDILSTVADPLGSPPPNICKGRVGPLGLSMHHAQHRKTLTLPAAEQGVGPHQQPVHPTPKTFVVPASRRGKICRQLPREGRVAGTTVPGPSPPIAPSLVDAHPPCSISAPAVLSCCVAGKGAGRAAVAPCKPLQEYFAPR